MAVDPNIELVDQFLTLWRAGTVLLWGWKMAEVREALRLYELAQRKERKKKRSDPE